MSLEHGKGEPLLRMIRRDAAAPAASVPLPERDAGPATPVAPQGVPPALPLFQARRVVSAGTLARIRQDFPGWDLAELQTEFDAWLAERDGRTPSNYDAAFYGFVRQHHVRRA